MLGFADLTQPTGLDRINRSLDTAQDGFRRETQSADDLLRRSSQLWDEANNLRRLPSDIKPTPGTLTLAQANDLAVGPPLKVGKAQYFVAGDGSLIRCSSPCRVVSGIDPDDFKFADWPDQTVTPPVLPPGIFVRKKLWGEFTPTQQSRIHTKLQDINFWRSGQPVPSGNWHPRDGILFENREGLLPPSAVGFREYRVLDKNGQWAGSRLVIDEANGTVYYSQHYSDDKSGFSEIVDIWRQLFGAW